jgi:hypothetical protein
LEPLSPPPILSDDAGDGRIDGRGRGDVGRRWPFRDWPLSSDNQGHAPVAKLERI